MADPAGGLTQPPSPVLICDTQTKFLPGFPSGDAILPPRPTTEMTNSSSRRIEATQRSAAEYLKVPVDDLKRFFPATSVGFWRDFKFEGQTWAAVQGAFDDARKQRQLVRKAGISQKDDWQPMDCKKALEILVMLLRCSVLSVRR